MNSVLPAEYRSFIDEISDYAQTEISPDALSRDIESVYPTSVLKKFSESRLTEIWEKDGSLSILKTGLVLEGVARHDTSMAAILLFNYITPAFVLKNYGNQESHVQILKELQRFKKSVSPIYAREVSLAETDQGELLLNDDVQNLVGGENSDYLLLIVDSNRSGGSVGCVISSIDEDVQVLPQESLLGLRSAGMSDVRFDNLLLKSSDLIMMGSDVQHNIRQILTFGIAYISLGVIKSAYQSSLSRSKERKQFKRAIIDFQAIQIKLSQMYAQIQSLEAYLYTILQQRGFDFYGNSNIAAAKILATDALMAIADDTVQIHGGYGYMKNDGIDRYMRDAKVLQVLPVSNELLHMQIAQGLKQGKE